MSPDDPVFKRWNAKLENWALWIAGVNACGGSAYDEEKEYNRAPRPPPPLVGAALDTDELVLRLSDDHRDSCRAMYVWTGTLLERAQYLDIQPRTLNDRVDAAMLELDKMDKARSLAMTKPPLIPIV